MHHRLSYADAFTAATAQELNATVVTGDAELVALRADGVRVERLVRRGRACVIGGLG